MEKFSIVEKVNVNKLNENIAAFIHKYNYEPYIFTSKDTEMVFMKKQKVHIDWNYLHSLIYWIK